MCTTTATSRMLLAAEVSAARSARDFVVEHWCPTHGGASQGTAFVLVTELIANAVCHGGAPITCTLQCTGPDGLLIFVSDGSGKLPLLRKTRRDALGGRGVQLIDLLSAEWGVEHHRHGGDYINAEDPVAGAGKTVWCRLTSRTEPSRYVRDSA